jgi:hypothetical protein
VAAEACRVDPRFRAAIDFDGILYGRSAADGVEQPFLYMSCDEPPPTPSELAKSTGPRHRELSFLEQDMGNIRRSLVIYGGYLITVGGTTHANFCDVPLRSPLKRLDGGAGPIGAMRGIRTVNAYTLAFFNRHLNERAEALLAGPSPLYPEVRFEAWAPRPPALEGSPLDRTASRRESADPRDEAPD